MLAVYTIFTLSHIGLSFIDLVSNSIQAHPSVGVVAIIEPQALGTLITGTSSPRCATAASYYRNLCVCVG